MSEEDDDPFGDVEVIPYNIWSVGRAVSVNDDGVDVNIVLYLACETHDGQIGVVLHPDSAAKIAVDLLQSTVNYL